MELITAISPHIKTAESTRRIMFDVIIALSPATLFGISIFGIRALLVVAVSIAAAVLSEALACYLLKKPVTAGDLSAVVTGLILALNLPPRIPLYMAAIGSAFAVIVIKMLFGGIGKNLLNPAAAARVFLLISFGGAMSTYYEPFTDLTASATPLSGGSYVFKELFFGVCSGCIGETSAVMLVFGGAYLVLRRVISLRIPLSFILTIMLVSLIAGRAPLTEVCSGGLLLGAIFMATDYTTSPVTPLGQLVFGIGCGLLTMLFRIFGGMPEGVSYSIVLMNFAVPVIDRYLPTFPLGTMLAVRKEEENV